MGIIKRGILGGFSKSVANVVGTSWKGIAVIKSKPLSVANPRTAGQVAQRTKFGNASQFASLILSTLIVPLMNRFAVQMSGYNDWVSRNIDAFNENNVAFPGAINFGTGRLGDTLIVSSEGSESNKTINITWNPATNNNFQQDTDVPFLLVINEDGTVIIVQYDGTGDDYRATGSLTLSNVEGLVAGANYFAYLVFMREDGTIKGNTSLQTFVANA